MSAQGTSESIENIAIEKEMHHSFLRYAMSVIVSRALPDVRDGMKPVHRRILYAMYALKVFHNRPFLKSARIVGDVLGKYHPHGDSSVYDALVRMAQDFAMRYPVIHGQGNFGSIDGDSAAAMRYTESRMQEYAEYLLTDIDKGTVDFVPNYDNKDMEPVVLPTRIPHLLVNGSTGIAVGMATTILPHNLAEIMDALQHLIEHPACSVDDLMQHLPGPDFPGGGEIHGIEGIRQGYLTGRGRIQVRGKCEVEEESRQEGGKIRPRIIIHEIPYLLNKARLVEKFAALVHEKKIDGIHDIRDESSKDGIRVVVECKRGESPQVILNHLYKLTPLQTSFSMNAVALVRGVPKLLGLKELLLEFYQFRREVVLRRTSFLLNKAYERQTLLLGLKTAVENIDEVVTIIREAADSLHAQQQLMERFSLLEVQAKAILEMRLARLTGLERTKIQQEVEEITAKIADYEDIMSSPDRVTAMILEDIREVRERFADPRRTVIYKTAADEITLQSLVEDESVVVTLSEGGYIKRTSTDDIQAQKRGGKGRSGMLMRDDDSTASVFECTNHQDLLCFTNLGRVYSMKVYQIPEAPLRSRGKHFANLLALEKNERVVSAVPVKSFDEDLSVMCATRRGLVKQTALHHFRMIRSSGIVGIIIGEDDALLEVEIVRPQDHVLLASRMGKVVRFPASLVRSTGRGSRGVRGIHVGDEGDAVVALEVFDPASTQNMTLLSVCENGYGKCTPVEEYRITSRGAKGVITIKVGERNGPLVGVYYLSVKCHVVLMTSRGTMLRMGLTRLSSVGRNTMGVRLMKVQDGEVIQNVGVIRHDDDDDEESESSSTEEDAEEVGDTAAERQDRTETTDLTEDTTDADDIDSIEDPGHPDTDAAPDAGDGVQEHADGTSAPSFGDVEQSSDD